MKKYIFKLVVLGDIQVGKTSLIFRYTDRRFLGEYKPTIGIDFSAKLVSLGKLNVDLVIWDLGGDEKYKILRRHYLDGARGCLLVYDISNKASFEHIETWFNDVRTYCGEIPCILIGNKVDLEDKRVVPTSEGEKLAEKLGLKFMESSAKTGSNVDNAFKTLTELMVAKYVT
ncbi:MAG: Rab family GTPase [Candidatus Odinarchaeia archaeon]